MNSTGLVRDILYEDARIIAVKKASGIAVGGDRWDGSKERLDRTFSFPVFTVHRIDRDTSGVVVFAKDQEAHRRLSWPFENRWVKNNTLRWYTGEFPGPKPPAACPCFPMGINNTGPSSIPAGASDPLPVSV
jgi:23S rRNA-/tRNA-specific pseudouridylate synthase